MLIKRVRIVPLVVLMLVAARCTLADSVDDYVRQQMKEKHIPGAVLIELKDGKILKQQSYGVANVELNVPMRDGNAFLVASITKVFVATAVFLLVQEGKLGLDDKVTQVISGLPEAWSDVTVLNCLSHTTGIPDIVRYKPGGFQWLAGTQEEALKLLSSMPLEHKPGEKSGYNGTEFLIVKMIVEKVSGMRLQDFLAKRIFEPLHMESARYGDTLDIIPNRASLYTAYSPSVDRSVAFDRWDDLVVSDNKIWNYRVPYPEWLYGAAGLNISALDLAKFDAALSQGTLLTKGSLEQMWTTYQLTNGELGRFTAGWMTRMWNGHKLVFHLGGDLVMYAHIPDEGISVIWLTNLDPSNPYEIVSGILQQMSH
jgi:CubicO group peptidase (beta-lactamase class C family)